MKSLFKKPIALLLTLSFLFMLFGDALPQTTHAQTQPSPNPCDSQFPIGSDEWRECDMRNNPALYKQVEDGQCGLTNLTQCFIDALLLIPGYLAVTLLKLVQWLTHISGVMLNYVVFYTVVDMKNSLGNAGAVEKAWQTVRDIGNMGFIFILLYAAIMTILGQGQNNQKLIVKVVMVAILINFSLFFTKIVIDISNVLAVIFYDAIAPGALSSDISRGLSNTLMEPLKLQSIFNATGIGGGEKLFIIGVAGIIFSLIAAFVFFAISIMLIIRFVVLIFVLALSPIAFLAMILPQLQDYGRDWSKALTSQAFFAPIYFALTWVVIVISKALLTKGGSFGNIAGSIGSKGETVAPPADTIEMLVNFMIVIAMLIASLTIAKAWANKTPGGVSKLTSWATGKAGTLTFGAAGWTARNSFGRASQAVAESEKLKDLRSRMVAREGLLGTVGGAGVRLAQATAKKGGSTNYDMRGAGFAGELGAGKPQKGGYEAERKARVKREEEYAKSQEPSDKAKAKVRIERDLVRKEAEEVRKVAEETAKQEIPNPQARTDLENKIAQAMALSQNPTISEEGRARARGRAEELKTNLASMDRDLEARRGTRATHLVSTSGIEAKVKAAEEKADTTLGVNKEEKDKRIKATEKEEKRTLETDVSIAREVEVTKRVEELTKRIEELRKEAEATGSQEVKDRNEQIVVQLTNEKEFMNLELERVRRVSDARKKAIKDEFKARKDAIKDEKSIGELRKTAEADAVEKSAWAKTLGYNYVAAAQIRKGLKKKGAKELIDEALKDTGEKKEEEKTEKEEGGDKEEK